MHALITGGAGFTPPLQLDAAAREGTSSTACARYGVYVLRSLNSGLLYIGCTSDLPARLKSHQERRALATKGKGPWELIYYEAYRHQADAYERERRLKQFGGAYRQLRQRLTCEFVSLAERDGGTV